MRAGARPNLRKRLAAELARTVEAINNAHVQSPLRAIALRRLVAAAGFSLALAALAAGCASPSKTVVDKVNADASQMCQQGNQAACHTIVQELGDTKVGITSTGALAAQTADCNRGNQQSCQHVAVMHIQLSSWCSKGNARACAAVNAGPWPQHWDEPALMDAATMSCLSGQFKPDSATCQALGMF